VTAGIPYRVPADDELGDRLGDVLAVIYLLFNEGYLCSAGDRPQRRDLSDDAEIVAVHAEAPTWEATDWPQILLLYDALLHHLPSPVIRLHRAIALGQVVDAQAALDDVDALDRELRGYHLFHATRAELLRRLDRPFEAGRWCRRPGRAT
jgi:predicted RNA polymerase sigma factor